MTTNKTWNYHIEVNGNLYSMRYSSDFFTFIDSADYAHLFNEVIDKLGKKRNYDFAVNDFFISLGYDFSDIKISDFLNPFSKMLFLKILADLEKEVGDIIIKEFNNYDEILDFQDTFKSISDRYYDIGMINFTSQQHNGSKKIKENFDNDLDKFKKYLKLYIKNK